MLIGMFLCSNPAYSSHVSHLRVPMGAGNRLQEILTEEEIFTLLSSKDTPDKAKIEIDKGLKALDVLENPEQVIKIIESVFANRGLELKIDPVHENRAGDIARNINIISTKDGRSIATRSFYTLTSLYENTLIFSYDGFGLNFIQEFAGKRLFPLMCRWMSAQTDFSKFSGWKIKVDRATYMSAKAWWRSGFPVKITSLKTGREIQSNDEINKDEEYNIEGTFLSWGDKQPLLASMETVGDGEAKEPTFIRLLGQEFSSHIDSGSPLQILDIGTEKEKIFPYRLKKVLEENGIKATIHCLSPDMDNGEEGGIMFKRGSWQDIIESRLLQESSYHIITLNAPSFIFEEHLKDEGFFLRILDYLLASDGVVVLRLHNAGEDETVGRILELWLNMFHKDEWVIERCKDEMNDLPEGLYFLQRAPFLMRRKRAIPAVPLRVGL